MSCDNNDIRDEDKNVYETPEYRDALRNTIGELDDLVIKDLVGSIKDKNLQIEEKQIDVDNLKKKVRQANERSDDFGGAYKTERASRIDAEERLGTYRRLLCLSVGINTFIIITFCISSIVSAFAEAKKVEKETKERIVAKQPC